MKQHDKVKLWASLSEVIDEWWMERGRDIEGEIPLVGENTIALMADAAIAVLMGVIDMHEYMRSEGWMEPPG